MAQLPLPLRIHIKIFETIGYATRPMEDKTRRWRWPMLWSCLLMVVYNAAAFTALFSCYEFLFNDDMFGWFNDILKVVFGNIAVTSSYFEAVWNRPHLSDFWKNYDKLQYKWEAGTTRGGNGIRTQRWSVWRQELWQNRKFLVIFYGIIGWEFTVAIIFVRIKEMTNHLVLFWSVFMPFIFATHMRNMQLIFFIELIRHELVKLKDDLHLMVDYSRFHAYGTGFKGFEVFLRSKIAEKQKDYQLIYGMYDHFQKAFGMSMVTVLLMIYVRVLVDAYFNYYQIYRGLNNAEAITLIPACMHIPIFLIVSKNCMDVVQYISLNLHCIISQFNNRSAIITQQIQNFSLQILHEDICINSNGITRFDGYMLARAIGSITTYMIFFIQFMPKYSNMTS